MLRRLLIGVIIISGLILGWNCDKPPQGPQPIPSTKVPVTARVLPHTVTDAEIGQEVICPVMGTKFKVAKDTLSAEYNGKIYYFCCDGCPEAFQQDPDKYATQAK